LRQSLEPQLQDQNEATQPLTTQDLPHKQLPEFFNPLDGLIRSLVGERYVLLEELGRGGMSVVYLAWDLILRRVVAIKALRKDKCDPEILRQEAAIALELTHESILRVYHFEPQREPDDTGPFLVMEYLPWTTGEKWIAEAGAGRLPVQTVVELGIRLCSGLEYAHKRNILHGDIKPGNVFVDSAGESAKLADFGLSRVVAEKSLHTLSLRPSGTPAYMAPEQRVRGEKVGLAADIYQLGATLWDFLTGEPPDSDRRIPRNLQPERARALKAVRKALAAQPGERYQNVTEFGRALEDVA
jgi:serine/threonine-protein kinase